MQPKRFRQVFVISTLLLLAIPFTVHADAGSGLVPCINNCGFNDLITLINKVITFLFEIVVLPIFIFLCMKAGWLYLTAGGNAAVHKRVGTILFNAIMGLVVMLCSWLIVKAIFVTLGYQPGLKFLE